MAAKKESSFMKTAQPFLVGGTAGMMATSCIQPIDMVKVRIQLGGSSSNPVTVARSIIAQDGFFSLYRGLSAGLLRQATYTTARMGLFRTFSNKLRSEDGKITFWRSAAAGLSAGGLGSVIGNPADLALVRMQADLTRPAAERSNYKNVGDALMRIAKSEGILGWWRGCAPTVVRAMSLNVGMLSTHDQAKQWAVATLGAGLPANLVAKGAAGFMASFMSLPFDFIKTRIQRMTPDPTTGKMPYKGPVDCAMQVFKNEGPLTFYKGFWTFYIRIAPHAMLTLTFVDFMNSYIKSRQEE